MEKIYDCLSFSQDPKVIDLFESGESLIFSDTIHKFNPYDWKQQRNIVITDRYLYNLKTKTLRRKINLQKIEALIISTHPDSKEFILHVPSEYDYLYTSQK